MVRQKIMAGSRWQSRILISLWPEYIKKEEEDSRFYYPFQG
jgi:hypothetical protein